MQHENKKEVNPMTIEQSKNHPAIALVRSDAPVIIDVQSALDLMATVRYETDCEAMVVEKSAFPKAFFDLSTCLAGDILQKITQYRMRIAIAGDLSVYKSKALRDFVYESNQGKQVYFGLDMESCENVLAGR